MSRQNIKTNSSNKSLFLEKSMLAKIILIIQKKVEI